MMFLCGAVFTILFLATLLIALLFGIAGLSKQVKDIDSRVKSAEREAREARTEISSELKDTRKAVEGTTPNNP